MPVLSAGISPGLLCGVEWATLCLLIFLNAQSVCAALSWCAPWRMREAMRHSLAIFGEKSDILHYHCACYAPRMAKDPFRLHRAPFWAGSLIANLLALTGDGGSVVRNCSSATRSRSEKVQSKALA
jgi:hypothetical protein